MHEILLSQRRSASLLLMFLAPLVLLACDGSVNPDPCPQGICVGGHPDLAGMPPTDGPAPAGDGAVGGCVEVWSCSPWGSIGNGMYTRKCSDLNRCGTTTMKPDEGPISLPPLDLDYYKCKVEPIVDRGCAFMGCHGTATTDNIRAYRVFARARRRNDQTVPPMCLDTTPQNLEQMGSGTTMCYGWTGHTDEEWQRNFDSARYLMIGVTNPDDCELLSQPVVGGKAHTGVHLFSSRNDPDYQTIRAWLSGTKLGAACDPMN